MYPVYHQLARELGLKLLPEEPGMMTFSFELVGDLEGHPVKLHRICGSGKRIDITSPIIPHLDLGFGFTRAGVISKVSEWFGKRDIQVDDPVFDKAFTIRGDEPDRVRALLGPGARAQIALVSAGDFEISDGEVSIGGRIGFGLDETFADLSAALFQATRIARALGQAHAVVPGATALAAHHELWMEYARSNQFQSGTTPLWMLGKLGKTWVSARATRNREDDFSLEFRARLENPLPVALDVQPKQSFVEAVAGSQARETGDASFDRVFSVTRATNMEHVDAELRRSLLAFAQLGFVYLQGSDVRLTLPATLDPKRVPAVLEELAAVLAIVEKNVHGPAGYR